MHCFTMSSLVFLVAVGIVSLVFLLKNRHRGKNLPPGSIGLPLIGESISFLRAQAKDTGDEWMHERVSKYGPIFKTSLLGGPTVIITGQKGNKFVLGADYDDLMTHLPRSVALLAGEYSYIRLPKPRYKNIKAAMVNFLNQESVRSYIGDLDKVILTRIQRETKDKKIVECVDLMKRVLLDVSCSVLFGIHDDLIIEVLMKDFILAFAAWWSIPLNFPGTVFRRGLAARRRIDTVMKPIIKKKRDDLKKGILSPKSDMITSLLSIGGNPNEMPLSEVEVLDNFILLMVASNTSSILCNLMIWRMANDEETYRKVREELNGIKREIEGEAKLTWGEVQKMKYTWTVAQELMRIHPLLFGNFRKAAKDLNYSGYDIPKGWQVFWTGSGTHMDENIFEESKTFDPSRFSSRSEPIPPFTYIPFGGGTHMCIGIEFARSEVLVVIYHMVTKFKWTQLYPDDKITRQPAPEPSMGLPIILEKIVEA